jgi:predicted ATP-grasp superfamily ATP-dependent carboligase
MATCRALGRAGIPVIGIDTDLDQPSARTRYATKVHCPDFQSGGPGLVESLEQIGRGLHEKGVLYPSGDLSLSLISEQRERLDPYFHISLPSKAVVEMFLNKKQFYQFAMDKGFPLPQTLFPKSPEHMRELAAGFTTPASSSRSSPMTPGGRPSTRACSSRTRRTISSRSSTRCSVSTRTSSSRNT